LKAKYPFSLVTNAAYYLVGMVCFILISSFQPSWNFLTQISIQAKDIETDRVGNIYVVSNTNQLYKYDATGKLLSTLNYAYQGNITHIDASNPMELYLFYREMNAVVFLDNNLAYRGKLNLSDAGITQASAIARSYNNTIWVFDQGDLQLKNLSKEGNLIQASGNVLQFAQSKNLNPSLIIDNGSRVFVNDSTEGILVFDVFANYIKTIPIKLKEEFKILNDELFYRSGNNLISYRFSTLQRDTLQLPDSNFAAFSVEKERLFVLNNLGISIYSYKPQK
jgi:hypothetical protein